MLAEDPELAVELLNILVTPTEEEPPAPPRVFEPAQRRTDAPQLEKVMAFFRGRENDLASVREITEGTDLTRNSINALLYTSKHKHHFVWVQEGPKRKLWRLREETDSNEEGHEVELQDGEEEQADESDE